MQKCALTPQREIEKLTNVILLMNQYTEKIESILYPKPMPKKRVYFKKFCAVRRTNW